MKPHTTSLALVAVPASAARPSAAETAARVHSESGKGLAEVDRELLRRAGVVKPGEDKGAR